MIISLIYAISANGVIGLNNGLPWRLPADLKYFKRLTTGHPVVMGRKTWQSIGKPLPQRTNIIITRQADFAAPGCWVAHSVEAGLALCPANEEVFVIGGAEIYRQALVYAHKVYLTRVHGHFAGDVFLPELNPAEWQEISRQDFEPDEQNPVAYSFLVYRRAGTEQV